jgi:quercetin dioxygenase-like cupin family protein
MGRRAWLSALAALLSARAAAAQPADEAMGRRVQQLLRAHQAEVFGCVAQQPKPVYGEALLRVIIGQEGRAARVEMLKAEPRDTDVARTAICVATAARAWDLGALGASPGDQVVFPLAFRPSAADVASGLSARIERVTLRANMSRRWKAEHATLLYVLGPGAPSVRSDGDSLRSKVGDLFLLPSGTEAQVVATAATALLQVQATEVGEPVKMGGGVTRIEAAGLTALPLFDGRGQVWLYLDEVELLPFSLQRLCAKKGVEVPRHTHDADELVYVLSGKATTVVDDQTFVEKPGDALTIPRGAPHALTVAEDLCAVQVYAPRGPEQRFKNNPRPANPLGLPGVDRSVP